MTGNRSDAEDVVQDSLVKVLKNRKQFDSGKGTFRVWFLKIVRNRCLDRLRKKRPSQLLEQHDAVDGGSLRPDQNLEKDELVAAVRVALEQISDEAKEILLLRDFDGLSYAEIADMLSIKSGTVMSRLHRARKQLRDKVLENQTTN